MSENSYLFLDLAWRLKRKMKVFEVKKMVLREGEAEKTKRQAPDARETEKFWNCLIFNPIFAKHAFFATQLTCE